MRRRHALVLFLAAAVYAGSSTAAAFRMSNLGWNRVGSGVSDVDDDPDSVSGEEEAAMDDAPSNRVGSGKEEKEVDSDGPKQPKIPKNEGHGFDGRWETSNLRPASVSVEEEEGGVGQEEPKDSPSETEDVLVERSAVSGPGARRAETRETSNLKPAMMVEEEGEDVHRGGEESRDLPGGTTEKGAPRTSAEPNSVESARRRRGRRSAREWSDLDLSEVEKEWKDGDDEEELVTADEELYRLSERRREEAMDKLNRVMAEGTPGGGGRIADTEEFERLAQEAQHAGKPGMIFARVREDVPPPVAERRDVGIDGEGARSEENSAGWDWDALAELCEEWKYQLEFEMVDITCYPMESDGTVLVTVQKGWNAHNVFRYLGRRGDVLAEVTWNDRKVRPKEPKDDEF